MDTALVSDVVTMVPGATANKRLGCDSGGTNFFPGDIADFFFWDANISDADALALYARTKHPGQIATTTLRTWITNGTSTPGINAARTLEVATMPPFSGTSLSNGPHGATTPIGLVADTDIKNAWVFDYPGTTLFTADSGKHFREPGSLIDRGVGQDPRYIIYVTEVQGTEYPGPEKWVVAYTSNSLASGWTRYGQVIADTSAEDPYVVKDGTDYWLMYEAGKLCHSTDGLSFTFTADLSISGFPGGSTINSQDTRYATAPAATGPWTDQGLAVDQIAATCYSSIAVPDDIVKIGSNYYLILHGSNLSGIFESSDLETWARYRRINQPDGAIMSTIQAGWGQFWDKSGDYSKLMVVNEAGASLGQTVALVQMYGDAIVPPTLVSATLNAAAGTVTTVWSESVATTTFAGCTILVAARGYTGMFSEVTTGPSETIVYTLSIPGLVYAGEVVTISMAAGVVETDADSTPNALITGAAVINNSSVSAPSGGNFPSFPSFPSMPSMG
jgi:hypothetical protein